MFVLRNKETGEYQRYACKWDATKNQASEWTRDLKKARIYTTLRSCQNSSAWKIPEYEFVEVEINLK